MPGTYDDCFLTSELPLFEDAKGLFWIPPSRLCLSSSSSSSSSSSHSSDGNATSSGSGSRSASQTQPVFDEEYRQIFASALVSSLTLQQTQKLLHNVLFDFATVTDLGLTPENLPALVELNEKVAHQCLFQVAGEPGAEQLLSSLINADLSLRSMEVVNKLIHMNKLSSEFINKYISHSIAYCNGMIGNRNLQSRFIRLVNLLFI